MTAEPNSISLNLRTSDMTFRIDEQKLYWGGQIEILGLDDLAKRQFLNSLPQPGETLIEKMEESFKKNKTVLPVDASPYGRCSGHAAQRGESLAAVSISGRARAKQR